MNKDFWKFENSVQNKEATLYIYGDIVSNDYGDWWNMPDDVAPSKFKNELTALGDVEHITVRINSGGGSVFAAYAIMNMLKSHKANVTVYNDGIAASAATIIAMAGDRIVSPTASLWMVHLPMASAFGNANDLKQRIDVLETITKSMVDIYSERTGITAEKITQMLEAETWFTGKEAKEMGFVDETTDIKAVAYLDKKMQTAFFNGTRIDITKFNNADYVRKKLVDNVIPINIGDTFQNTETEKPKTKEIVKMSLDEFKNNYTDIYNAVYKQAYDEAYAKGVSEERERIKEIENMSLVGMEAMAIDAKFENALDPASFAIAIIKAQKEQGQTYLSKVMADAKPLAEVEAQEPVNNIADAEEEAILKEIANMYKEA